MNKHDLSNHEVTPWFDGDKIYPQRLYMHIRNEHDLVSVTDVRRNSAYHYLYDADMGYYKMLSERECSLFIKSHLPEEMRKATHWGQVLSELNTDDAVDMSKMDADESIINFRNGVLDISTGAIRPHSPEILSSVQIPCDFRPELTLTDAPVFSRFLNDITSGEEELKTILLEYMGSIMSNVKGYRYKKLIILHGLGNTGKSQLRELMMDLLGEHNCHSITLQQLNSRFGPAQIYGKRFVGSGEVKAISLNDVNTIKELTAVTLLMLNSKERMVSPSNLGASYGSIVTYCRHSEVIRANMFMIGLSSFHARTLSPRKEEMRIFLKKCSMRKKLL